MIDGPDFMIIGAMKSATSTLHEQLAANPGFFMSRPKEPNFFSDDAVWARGLDWYSALFASAPPMSQSGPEGARAAMRLFTVETGMPRRAAMSRGMRSS